MTYVLIFILTAILSTHGMRFAQGRGCRMDWVGVWLYLTASVSALGWVLGKSLPVTGTDAFFGSLAGLALGLTYLLFVGTIRRFGVGIAHLTRQLGLAIPILASLFIWGESELLTPLRALGLVLVFAALPLMSKPNALPHERHRAGLWLLPVMLFACAGLAKVLFKAYGELPGRGHTDSYLIFLCAGAGVLVLGRALGERRGFQRRDLLFGLLIGLDNALLNFSRVRAIESVAGTKVFPTMSLGVILLSLTLAAIIWKERFRGRVLVGMALAVLALILVNWK